MLIKKSSNFPGRNTDKRKSSCIFLSLIARTPKHLRPGEDQLPRHWRAANAVFVVDGKDRVQHHTVLDSRVYRATDGGQGLSMADWREEGDTGQHHPRHPELLHLPARTGPRSSVSSRRSPGAPLSTFLSRPLGLSKQP